MHGGGCVYNNMSAAHAGYLTYVDINLILRVSIAQLLSDSFWKYAVAGTLLVAAELAHVLK
jgi:hypothetical protein